MSFYNSWLFVSLYKDILVLSDLFDVVTEFSLELVWMVICFNLNALYHIKHRVLILIKLESHSAIASYASFVLSNLPRAPMTQ